MAITAYVSYLPSFPLQQILFCLPIAICPNNPPVLFLSPIFWEPQMTKGSHSHSGFPCALDVLRKPLSRLSWQTRIRNIADRREGRKEVGIDAGQECVVCLTTQGVLLLESLSVGLKLLLLTGSENYKREINIETGSREGRSLLGVG